MITGSRSIDFLLTLVKPPTHQKDTFNPYESFKSNFKAFITLDENLTFNEHLNNVRTKVSKSVSVMRGQNCQLPANVMVKPRSKKLRGERKVETNASTLVGVTSHVTISAKIHCK